MRILPDCLCQQTHNFVICFNLNRQNRNNKKKNKNKRGFFSHSPWVKRRNVENKTFIYIYKRAVKRIENKRNKSMVNIMKHNKERKIASSLNSVLNLLLILLCIPFLLEISCVINKLHCVIFSIKIYTFTV